MKYVDVVYNFVIHVDGLSEVSIIPWAKILKLFRFKMQVKVMPQDAEQARSEPVFLDYFNNTTGKRNYILMSR
jgi:hypothetical protein